MQHNKRLWTVMILFMAVCILFMFDKNEDLTLIMGAYVCLAVLVHDFIRSGQGRSADRYVTNTLPHTIKLLLMLLVVDSAFVYLLHSKPILLADLGILIQFALGSAAVVLTVNLHLGEIRRARRLDVVISRIEAFEIDSDPMGKKLNSADPNGFDEPPWK